MFFKYVAELKTKYVLFLSGTRKMRVRIQCKLVLTGSKILMNKSIFHSLDLLKKMVIFGMCSIN